MSASAGIGGGVGGGLSNPNDKRASPFTRQATILRKNLLEWDRMLRNPRGEDWPTMLGRLNAALNQTANMDRSIEDLLEHFVYLPKQATANPGDIPFFLSTRLELASDDPGTSGGSQRMKLPNDPTTALSRFEDNAAQLASEYEEMMVRF